MKILGLILGVAAVVATTSNEAAARPLRASGSDDNWAVRMGLSNGSSSVNAPRSTYQESSRRTVRSSGNEGRSSRSSGIGGRPSAWCGWWMRTQRGGGPEYNLAANWRRYGRPGQAQVGAVVVWNHHVGQIVGRASNGQWLVQSGNDGGAVRTRARSISGATVRV
jgi:hypothetical protein